MSFSINLHQDKKYRIYGTPKNLEMEVSGTVNGLQEQLKNQKLKPVGFVPTMGALHSGHIALVEMALEKSPLVVVSIFVNPNQFNDKNDLKNYPRTLEKDLKLLGKVLRGNDLVFTPSVEEIYPQEDKRVFHFGNLDNVMEASHRPGHFNGVAQVVSRLFAIIDPDFAIFGQKDFQQLAVIKALVKQTGSRIEIIGHPIIREDDGLAMSSRNQLLGHEIRQRAPVIYKTLIAASSMVKKNDITEVKEFVSHAINNTPEFSLEYFEIVDDISLIPVISKSENTKDKHYYGCIAVKAGKIRLIDNLKMDWSEPKG